MSEPQTYRKKPVEIQAMGPITAENSEAIRAWCDGDQCPANTPTDSPIRYDGALIIPTLEGPMTASLGDYVICGIQGEFYPCKPDIFAKTYELVE
jgi:hypothetical protein